MIRFSTMTLMILFATAPMTGAGKSEKPGQAERLHQLFDREWDWSLRESPETATYVGDPRYNDRWSDLSAEAIERRKEHARAVLKEIRAIDRASLSAQDELNYDLFLWNSELDVEGAKFPSELMPINQMNGVQQTPADIFLLQPQRTVGDLEKVLARLRALPVLIDQNIALMRRGVAAGIMPPRIAVRSVGEALQAHQVDDPAKSPLYTTAFTNIDDDIPVAQQERLRNEAKTIIRDQVIPAYARLARFWNEEYFPKTRESIGITALPNGKEWYEREIKFMTTTTMTPDQIHELGLAEVKRIRAEMEKIREKTSFKGSLQEFFVFLRTDPQFFFTDPQMLLMTYRDIAKRIDPGLTKLFGKLPRTPYGVIPVPSYSEKTETTAYYNQGSLDSGRPGYFYANLYDLKSRPKWEMEALTVHEAVPGHHLQISLAQEMEGIPKFRREGNFTAFIEGWGLYSESLGAELGLYTDPYSQFGQLTYQMWRAVRLVVDTGMHSKGWTRQQAIDFFMQNSSKSEHDITVEIDRYIVWPGQALAYKLGQLKISELRAYAESELGERFDIRSFHDTVLGAGPLPLAVLDTRVRDWVRQQKSAGTAH